jgi:4-alpha-glucanotransferase
MANPLITGRSSGVLLHPTSLPGGRLGDAAHAFVDWLAQAGQTWWQTLPLGPPDEHGSPYASASAFAADPALLADPGAPVGASERAALRRRSAAWLADWEAWGGDVDDQVRFDREWSALRRHARERGVRLLGDLPIYVAPDGADHRAHPELFRDGAVAGAPPDDYSPDGQHWGNPLYDWPALRRRGYRWWVQRLRRNLELFDAVRIDHFRGFVAYWAIPAGDRTARRGRWVRGPGAAPFRAMRRAIGGELPLVAEDLGVITEPVRRLRDALGLPGMVVVQFGFDPDDPDSPHRIERHPRRAVVYVGTHDNLPAAGWWATASDAQRAAAVDALARAGVREREPHWALVELAQRSRAATAILQAQDVLGLGAEARMNTPGTMSPPAPPNWRWRLDPGALDGALARRLRAATEAARRA